MSQSYEDDLKMIFNIFLLPEKKRLGKMKSVVSKILLAIPSYQNSVARDVIDLFITNSNNYLEICQYCLYNMYYGFFPKIEQENLFFISLCSSLGRRLRQVESTKAKGCILGALANLGPHAVKIANGSDDYITKVATLKKDPFLLACAKKAYEQLLTGFEDGSPILTKKELERVRGEFGEDVLAYQESVHYEIDVENTNKGIKHLYKDKDEAEYYIKKSEEENKKL